MWGSCSFLVLTLVASCSPMRGNMTGYIVGGNYTDIEKFPYSSHIVIKCKYLDNIWMLSKCGASVVNQVILLTAAHCLASCKKGSQVIAGLGSSITGKGALRTAHSFVIHQDYNMDTMFADVALILLTKPIKFGPKISRVALMKRPPYNEPAVLAGWGLISEDPPIDTERLKSVKQSLINLKDCNEEAGSVPVGAVCARNLKKEGFGAEGDSGSALIVRGFIQIGLVSFKYSARANDLVVYSDVGYFYNWISETAKRLVCKL